METYSPFFETLHDDEHPIGFLGEGAHYAIFRAIVFHDLKGSPLSEGQYHDFAVIWDDDHDDRVIEAIDKIYVKGLLSRFIIFGETRAALTALSLETLEDQATLENDLKAICNDIVGDRWRSSIGTLKDPKEIIEDKPENVRTYLENINNLWWLGSKPVNFD